MRTTVDQRNWKRDSYNGFGNGLAKAFEFAMVPAIFGAAGFGLDHLLGILPVFTIIFAVVAMIGLFVKWYYTYAYQMELVQAGAPWKSSTTDSGAT